MPYILNSSGAFQNYPAVGLDTGYAELYASPEASGLSLLRRVALWLELRQCR